MLDHNDLTLALDLHRRSYRLLLWLGDRARQNENLAHVLHESISVDAAAFEWLSRLYECLPKDTRPERPFLQQYANFFSTYITTSFELNPQQTRTISRCGCYCPYCSYIVAASRLKPRSTGARDRKRATRLMEDRLIELAYEEDVAQPGAWLYDLLDDEELKVAAGWSTYGSWLIRRCNGVSAGSAVLVLWRRLKVDRSRSYPYAQGLRFQDFIQAEESLTLAIGELARRQTTTA